MTEKDRNRRAKMDEGQEEVEDDDCLEMLMKLVDEKWKLGHGARMAQRDCDGARATHTRQQSQVGGRRQEAGGRLHRKSGAVGKQRQFQDPNF